MKSLASRIFDKQYKHNKIHIDISEFHQIPELVFSIIYPQKSNFKNHSIESIEKKLDTLNSTLTDFLEKIRLGDEHAELDNQKICNSLLDHFENLIDQINLDAQSIFKGDPAAISVDEVILCYPGFHAIAIYRLANFFYKQGVPYLPRILSEYAHSKTGVDIHPGAQIGNSFFIDHGTGIVIGETSIIGNSVKIYQGVTLGALSVDKKMAGNKRHPTIEDHVILYANSTILGGETVIGKNSVVGGNCWITKSIPANSKISGSSTIA